MIKDKSIYIKNIYYMLSYAFSTLNQGGYESVKAESFDNIHDLMSAILAKGISLQLKQGLYREYVLYNQDLNTLRGKINMPGTILNKLSSRKVLNCEYDELSENNLFNQILKSTALLMIRRSEAKEERKANLRNVMLFFSAVDEIDLKAVKWTMIRFQRNNRSYRMLISLCQLIVEGMLQTTEDGEYRLASFVDQEHMERLYEKFILEYYIQEFPKLSVSSSKIEWAVDDGERTMLPSMQSDIMISKGSIVLIIDAKYYTHTLQSYFDTNTIRSNNLYQIFTYVKNKDAEYKSKPHTVSGMLLYAATDEAIQPDNDYMMSGNKISVKTLDLNREFKDIAGQLNAIAKEQFEEG